MSTINSSIQIQNPRSNGDIVGVLPQHFDLTVGTEQITRAREALFSLSPSTPAIVLYGNNCAARVFFSPQLGIGTYVVEPFEVNKSDAALDNPASKVILEYKGNPITLDQPYFVRQGASLLLGEQRITLPNNFNVCHPLLAEKFPHQIGFHEKKILAGDETQTATQSVTFGRYAAITDTGVNELILYAVPRTEEEIIAGVPLETYWLERGRENNEDCIGVDVHCDGRTLLVVADGIGGDAGGEIASRRATESILELFLQDMPIPTSFCAARDMLTRFVRETKRADLARMGTVLIAAEIYDTNVTFHHAGDCRGYLFRPSCQDTILVHRTRDHSQIEKMLTHEIITQEDARKILLEGTPGKMKHFSPDKGISLSFARGPNYADQALPTSASLPLEPGDIVILCSDGMSTTTTDENIRDIVAQHAHDPVALRDALHAHAIENTRAQARFRDNISIVVYIHEGSKPPIGSSKVV